jgi:hypothetical protein
VHTGSTSRRAPQQAGSQHHQNNDAGRPTTLSLLKSVPMARSRYAKNNVHGFPLNSLLFLQTCVDEWAWGTERMIGSRRWKQSCSSLRKHRRLALSHLSQHTHHSQQNRALIRNRRQMHLSKRHQQQQQSQYRGLSRHYLSYRGCRHQHHRLQAPWCVLCHRARVMRD